MVWKAKSKNGENSENVQPNINSVSVSVKEETKDISHSNQKTIVNKQKSGYDGDAEATQD